MRPGDLNYQHLRYFHAVAHEGSVLRASRSLGLSPSTVSGQIKTLEAHLGSPLFARAGRNLVLTPFGREVLELADRIFDIGDQLVERVNEGVSRRRVRIGVDSVLPKLLVRDLLLRGASSEVILEVEQGPTDELLGKLASRRLDLVLSDAPSPSWFAVRASSVEILTGGLAIFGSDSLAARIQRMPDDLAAVPWLVPPQGTSVRTGLERWWESLSLHPEIAAVVDDSAVLKALGDAGLGVFAASEHMIDAVVEGYHVRCIGVTQAVTERVFGITREGEANEGVVRDICGLTPEAA